MLSKGGSSQKAASVPSAAHPPPWVPEAPVYLEVTQVVRDGQVGGAARASSVRIPCLVNVGNLSFRFPDSPGTLCPLSWFPRGGSVPAGAYLPAGPVLFPLRWVAMPPCLPSQTNIPPLLLSLSASNKLNYIPFCPFSKGFQTAS